MIEIVPAVSLALRCAVMALVLVAAWEDVRQMRIRNDIALAVAVLFIPMLFLLPMQVAGTHVLVGGIFFMAGVAMFFAKLIGGGDAKLIGALGLWPALLDVPTFLMVMTISGGVLALLGIGLKRAPFLPRLAAATPESGWFAALARGETVVPYGVAIALAAAVTLF